MKKKAKQPKRITGNQILRDAGMTQKSIDRARMAAHLEASARIQIAVGKVLTIGGELLRDEFGMSQEDMNRWVTLVVKRLKEDGRGDDGA